MRNAHTVLIAKPEWNEPLRTAKHRCEENTAMNLKKQQVLVLTGFIWLRIGASGWLL
jgi:hypothetical protein